MYARNVNGRELSFGVSGMLWRENLVMYDRQTDSWWAQATGRAFQGEFEGASLEMLLSYMMTWKEWQARHPNTLVLSKMTARGQRGMRDGYATRHTSARIGATGRTRAPGGDLDAKERMAAFRFDGLAYAVKLADLAFGQVVLGQAGGETFVVAGTEDGSGARAFRAGSHVFTLREGPGPAVIVDEATGSEWRAFDGLATSGRLAGTELEEIPVTLSFWFAWRAFFPSATVFER